MNAAVVGLAAAGGAGLGLASGWLAVWLESVEGLEKEERDERREYDRETAERAAAATKEGREPPAVLPWDAERYGWTRLERYASPVLTALGFASFTAHEGPADGLFIHLLWVAVLCHITLFDVKHRLILDRVSLPAVALALVLAPLTPGLGLRDALLGGAAVGGFFGVQSLVLGDTVLGLGDAKLGVVVGATTGLGTDLDHLGALYAVIAAVVSAGLMALALLVLRLRRLRDPIPYGPFLCAGCALILYHGAAGP